MNVVGTADHYAQFVRLARARIAELGITYATVDEICGFPDHYTSILLSGGRAMSVYSFFTLARSLALLPVFHHDGAELAKLEQHSHWIKVARTGHFRNEGGKHWRAKHSLYGDYWKKWGRVGGMARARKMTRGQRRKAAQVAALARWEAR